MAVHVDAAHAPGIEDPAVAELGADFWVGNLHKWAFAPRGTALLAVDAVGAGIHEKVLIVIEGRAAGEALGRKAAPVDAAVIGIVDEVDIHE